MEAVEQQAEQEWHRVSLLLRVPAATPQVALEEFLEQIVAYGLRDWHYVVINENTTETRMFDGYGIEYPITGKMNTPRVEEPDDDIAEDDDEDDDEDASVAAADSGG
jgi:hypothetical protein